MQSLKQFSEQNLSTDLSKILAEIAKACFRINSEIRHAALTGNQGKAHTENIQGEEQKTLDIIADNIFTSTMAKNPLIAGLVSEEVEGITWTSNAPTQDQYMLYFDPLDGSSNIDVNLSIGTIFSIYKKLQNGKQEPFQTGRHQKLAGYAIYGPSVMLVISDGYWTHGFTLDERQNVFLLSHPQMDIPVETNEFAINASRRKHWYQPIAQYIDDCLCGENGSLTKNYNMRWAASMVADVHRVLIRGGVFLYPKDRDNAPKGGKLRLMYEANPMALIVQGAGGNTYSGHGDILDIIPEQLHQRVGVILGSATEVTTIKSYFNQSPVNNF